MKQACRYNIIRFEPYTETQEFVNIGIVLYVPESRQFEFKLLPPNNYGRITGFFKALDKAVFQEAIHLIRNELERIGNLMDVVEKPEALYREVVRAREGIIHYSNHRTRFTVDPLATVTKLFDHYVHHSFTREKSHEEQMRGRIADLLRKNDLSTLYKDRTVGEGKGYPVRLPFVTAKEIPAIIKPLHFQHADSKKLIDHGLQWLATMNQLFRLGVAKPESTLITYKPPVEKQGILYDSFLDIQEQIQEINVKTLNINETAEITQFARTSASS